MKALHEALHEAGISRLYPVKVAKNHSFQQAIASTGLGDFPLLNIALSVPDEQVPKRGGKDVDQLASFIHSKAFPLLPTSVHRSTFDASWLQLGRG